MKPKYPFHIIVHVPFFKGYNGMALYPFILVKYKYLRKSQSFMIHELIHFKQQQELLIIPFYILYLLNYLINLIRYQNHWKAYYNICFEREAYQNELKEDYLQKRKLFAFLKYY